MTDITHTAITHKVSLPVGSIGARASGWWGLWFLLLSEASIFAYLFFSYFYFSIQPPADWIPGASPDFSYSAPQSVIILVGCVTAWFAHRSIAGDRVALALVGLGLTLLLCSGFIALQFIDWYSKPFGLSSSTYSSEYFVITGFHLAHIVVGWFMFAMLFIWTALGYFDSVRHLPITIGKVYWYFLAVIWLAIFFVLYGTPFFF
ncbi:MAG TPA: cytochrome c oxidase subunit 3 [Pseudolabrys sp.]|nr:cytochrome c oxidase subunit 3 [Pseudolabrys sp.]